MVHNTKLGLATDISTTCAGYAVSYMQSIGAIQVINCYQLIVHQTRL